jgi:hypothetical protein
MVCVLSVRTIGCGHCPDTVRKVVRTMFFVGDIAARRERRGPFAFAQFFVRANCRQM